MTQVITALEVPEEIFDRIVAMLQKHSGVNCDVWTFMKKEPAQLMFQGCPVIRRTSKLEVAGDD